MNLGVASLNLSDIEQAIDYYTYCICLSNEMERRVEEQQVLTRLGNAYYGQHDFKQAAECNTLSLNIAKELRDRSAEARAY